MVITITNTSVNTSVIDYVSATHVIKVQSSKSVIKIKGKNVCVCGGGGGWGGGWWC